MPTPLTLYQQHVQSWKACTACFLHETRQHVVLGRGKVPCDIVFVGEAPGENENLIGRPFVGPAGNLLDQIIASSVPPTVTYALTNLVCCIPREVDLSTVGQGDGKVARMKAAQPELECIEACAPRLQEFVQIADPRLIVCVGALARDVLSAPKGVRTIVGFHKQIELIDIVHPAAILRANIAQRGLAVRRCVVTIHTAVQEVILSSPDHIRS